MGSTRGRVACEGARALLGGDYALRNQRAVITAAYREAAVAAPTVEALQRGAVAARANYDQAENRFRVGIGTSTELADAQALRTDADIQLAIARFQMARTRAALSSARWRRLDEQS